MTMTQRQTTRSQYGRNDVLVEPEWLQEHLHDPGLRLVEVDVSAATYDAGHIDGAVLWNVYVDLKDANYATVDADSFQDLVRRCGITPGSTVVFYGYAPAMGLWLLRLFGHRDVRILNCSRAQWLATGGSLTAETPPTPATSYVLPEEDDRIRATLARVGSVVDDPAVTIVDVRSGAEFRGDAFWPSGGAEPGGRAGHVPTAAHVPIDGVLDERGRFRDPASLCQVFADLDLSGDAPIITYCTIGGRASTAWFVLTDLLGRPNVAVYDGSWAQWGRDPATPVARP
ncbi:MAG: thiosulfate/3-mercaptopyruvate sulfurtransferase [Blastococcus sp.]|jgi:thiosulfate/3-mercaptopyruvate sulfurtransferase|nr:thiosulfate/3-mercaptopyruvate sulfurtransferase [Blastococcus sp.]